MNSMPRGKPFSGADDPRRCTNSPGRPRSLRTQIEQHFGPNGQFAWEKLANIMNGREESIQERVLSDGRIVEVRVKPTISEKKDAAELAIAYLEGKPTQTTVSASVDIPAEQLTDSDLRGRVAEILAKFAAPALPDAVEREVSGKRMPALPVPSKG